MWVGLWKAASLAENRDQGAAGDDEDRGAGEPRADELRPLEEEDGERDAPERLRRDERRDDRHAGAVVRREEADVGEPEEEPGDGEGPPGDHAGIGPERAPTCGGEEDERAERACRHRDCGSLHGAARGLAGIPADEVVPAREEKRCGKGERDYSPSGRPQPVRFGPRRRV